VELNLTLTHSVGWTQQQPAKSASSSVQWSQDAVRVFEETVTQQVVFTQGFTLLNSLPVESSIVFSHSVGLEKITNLDVSQSIVWDGD
jgi:hypothetical protein